MSGELELDARELMELAEEAPEQVETIIQMLIDADQEQVDEAETDA